MINNENKEITQSELEEILEDLGKMMLVYLMKKIMKLNLICRLI